MKNKYLIIIGLLGTFGCRPNAKISQVDTTIITSLDTSHPKIVKPVVVRKEEIPARDSLVRLSEGFSIKINVGGDKETGNLQLFHLGKRIDLGDRDSAEYVIEDRLYPIVNKIDSLTFELLFEMDERPNKNLLKLIRVENDKVVKIDKLPTFITKASDLDGDGVLEYAGIWDYSEEYGPAGKIMRTADPILYYKLSKNGIKLDTTMTMERNRMIYGKFYGFQWDGKTAVNNAFCEPRITKEFHRIINNAKTPHQ